MIIDVIKHHSIPHVCKKKTTKEMVDALVSLYQSENINKNTILHNKLKFVEMNIFDTVTSLTNYKHIHDQIATVGRRLKTNS